MARTRLGEDPAQMLDFGIAAHETREPAQRPRLQARACLTRPGQLEDLDWIREAFHRDGPERAHLDIAPD